MAIIKFIGQKVGKTCKIVAFYMEKPAISGKAIYLHIGDDNYFIHLH